MKVRKLIERLGGSAAVARKIGLSDQAIYHAMRRDRVSEMMGWRLLHAYPEQVSREELDLPEMDGAA